MNNNKENINREELYLFTFKIIFGCALIMYIGAMFYFSLIPGEELKDTIIPKYSIILHFMEFFCLCLFSLLFISLYELKHTEYYIIGLIIFMSIITETIQIFVPGRFFSLLDVVTNLCGGLFFMIIILIISIKNNHNDP